MDKYIYIYIYIHTYIKFYFQEQEIEIVKQHTHLGFTFIPSVHDQVHIFPITNLESFQIHHQLSITYPFENINHDNPLNYLF